MYTARFNSKTFSASTGCSSVFVWILEQKAIISRYSISSLAFRRVRFNCEKRLLGSSCVPVRPSACNSSAHTRQLFVKIDIEDFSKICRENCLIKF